MPVCACCGENKDKQDYSSGQLKRKGKRRCITCIANPPAEAPAGAGGGGGEQATARSLKLAADQGDARAQSKVGLLYLTKSQWGRQ